MDWRAFAQVPRNVRDGSGGAATAQAQTPALAFPFCQSPAAECIFRVSRAGNARRMTTNRVAQINARAKRFSEKSPLALHVERKWDRCACCICPIVQKQNSFDVSIVNARADGSFR
jgi:hypothetical protein